MRASTDLVRDELINALLTFAGPQTIYADLPDEVRRVCKQAADALSGPSHQGWISVKDRLPELNGWYMAWFQGDHAILDFDNQIGWYWGDGEHVMEESYAIHITHWMELPDAPSATDCETSK